MLFIETITPKPLKSESNPALHKRLFSFMNEADSVINDIAKLIR